MPESTACHSDHIELFLNEQLDTQQQREFEQHLESCASCRERLEDSAADAMLWDDVRTLSSHDEIRLNAADHAANDPPAEADRSHVRLNFLSATDDPHMLGRFAGYDIAAVIGQGGMGIVLKGYDRSLNRFVAIKVLLPHYAASGAARQRFERETRAAAAVVHDHVVAIHGVEECDGLPYLVMPYVRGESLQKRLARAGALSVPEILRIAMQTARGLAAAHDQGLVHRDIKPGNILLPSGVERVMITDFGLARAADDASLTRSGIIAGTPQYMSPEQAQGEALDARSDLFSLGSVMYAMCTGHPPFRAETAWGILRRITDDEPRPLRQHNPALPIWLCAIISRLLRKSPKDRYDSAAEVATLLEDCLAHVQQPDVVPLPAAVPTTRSRVVYLLFASVVTAIAIAGFMWLTQMSSVGPAVPDTHTTTLRIVQQSETTSIPSTDVSEPTAFNWEQSERLDALETELRDLRSELLAEEYEKHNPD